MGAVLGMIDSLCPFVRLSARLPQPGIMTK